MYAMNCSAGSLSQRDDGKTRKGTLVLVEQKLAKSRVFKAEPLPICKMENDYMNDMTRC